jgi:hypothetical protein
MVVLITYNVRVYGLGRGEKALAVQPLLYFVKNTKTFGLTKISP